MTAVDHPAMRLLADTLAATRAHPNPRLHAEDVAKLLGHCIRGTGHRLVKVAPADLDIPHNHDDADDLHWHTCPACALLEGFYRGQVDQAAPGSGAASIAWERKRQVGDEGYADEHDDTHTGGELAMAAAAYAIPNGHARRAALWPFDEPMKAGPRTRKDRIRELVKAGALIAAEIDRLRRNR